MDESAREGRPAVDGAAGTEQDKSPQELREDIERSRAELGDTVEALAEKADVKGQAKERITGLRETAQQKKDEFVGKAKAASPEGASAGAQQAASAARENPLPLAAGGAFLAGFLIGRLTSR